MGGDLTVDSALGQGSSFTLVLRLARPVRFPRSGPAPAVNPRVVLARTAQPAVTRTGGSRAGDAGDSGDRMNSR